MMASGICFMREDDSQPQIPLATQSTLFTSREDSLTLRDVSCCLLTYQLRKAIATHDTL